MNRNIKRLIGVLFLGLALVGAAVAQDGVVASQIQSLRLGVNIPSNGSLVGGPDGTPSDPLRYAAIQSTTSTGTRFVVDGSTRTGTQYPDVEYYSIIPTADLKGWTSGPLYLDFDITPDTNTPLYAQCLESTTILVAKGPDGKVYKYNVATQLDVAAGWVIEAINPAESWSSTGFRTGPLAVNEASHIRIAYSFNLEKHTKSIISYAVNGVVYKLPASFQNLPAQPSTWEQGLYTQWQWGLNKLFGDYGVLVDNATYASN
jgi:hypothetical protein